MSRTAVVTGTASGIGAAIASALERDGWTVAGLDAKLAAPYGVDTSDPAAVSEALSRIADDVGPIDAVVSAAGHYDMTPVSQITAEQLRRMLRVHLGGLRNLARSVLPSMISRGQGAIVAITSELAIGGGDGDAHYAAAKGAVIGLVRSLAAEVAEHGVRVNGVAPGPTDTPLLSADSPWRAPEYLRTLPNRRLTRPDEIAKVVQFLLDDDATFCTGEIISPNSGAVI
jgi:NAD(P)-dependent dehydrogenase (short-subunit alcohol dehydrogenase family)